MTRRSLLPAGRCNPQPARRLRTNVRSQTGARRPLMGHSGQRQSRGFTLLEMMVALALLALIGLIGSQILRSVLQSGELSREHVSRLGAAQQVFNLLEQDISQALPRPVPADLRYIQPTPLSAVAAIGAHLQLVRRNWLNPASYLPRGSLEEVQWQRAEGGLQRWSRSYVPPAQDATRTQASPFAIAPPARLSAVFPQVSDMRLRYAINGRWQTDWFAAYTLPQAVEVTLTLDGYGELMRVFFITEAR